MAETPPRKWSATTSKSPNLCLFLTAYPELDDHRGAAAVNARWVAPETTPSRRHIAAVTTDAEHERPRVFRATLLLGRRRKLTVPPEVGVGAETAVPEAVLAGAGPTEGRSLGQIAWMRLKKDRVALAGGVS